MLTWSDIRAIDSITDPLGVVAVFVEGRPAGVMVAGMASVQLFQWQMGAVEEVGEYRFAGASASWRRGGARLAAGLAGEVRDIAVERAWRRVLVAGDSRLAHTLARHAAPDGCEGAMVTGPVGGLPPR